MDQETTAIDNSAEYDSSAYFSEEQPDQLEKRAKTDTADVRRIQELCAQSPMICEDKAEDECKSSKNAKKRKQCVRKTKAACMRSYCGGKVEKDEKKDKKGEEEDEE